MFSAQLTDSAVLRPLQTWHAREFADHLDRARDHIRPWVGPSFVTDTVDGAGSTLRRYADAEAADGGRLYGIWDAGVLIGGVMFVSFDAVWGTCEVGCWLEPSAEGRGLITRSVSVVLDWAFAVRGISRAEWRCRADNGRSIAVAHRLGMRSEGVLRSSWVFEGRRFDTEVLSVLREEWRDGDR